MSEPRDAYVIDALELCGRHRVFHSNVAPAQVLITSADDGPTIIGNGATGDEAGRDAAMQFAERLRKQAKDKMARAERIEALLRPR